MTKKTKEEILAEIAEIKTAVLGKEAEYKAALQDGRPADDLQAELIKLQHRLAVDQAIGNLEIALLDHAEEINQKLAEQQQKLNELKEGGGSDGQLR